MVRSTASGLTAHVDRWGRIIATAPYYEEAHLVTDVRVPADRTTTAYTRFGDWFPVAAGIAAVAIALLAAPFYVRLYTSPEARSHRRLERMRRDFLRRKLSARRKRVKGSK
jgi:hypothetical protein